MMKNSSSRAASNVSHRRGPSFFTTCCIYFLTSFRGHVTTFPSSLIEGRRPETILKAERGVASCDRRLVTAGPGRFGDFARPIRRQCRRRRPRPRAQNGHGGAPKGERAFRVKRNVRAAPHPRGSLAPMRRDGENKMRLSALRPPLGSG